MSIDENRIAEIEAKLVEVRSACRRLGARQQQMEEALTRVLASLETANTKQLPQLVDRINKGFDRIAGQMNLIQAALGTNLGTEH